MNSNQFRDFNLKPETPKPLKEKHEETLDIGIDNRVLTRTPIAPDPRPDSGYL